MLLRKTYDNLFDDSLTDSQYRAAIRNLSRRIHVSYKVLAEVMENGPQKYYHRYAKKKDGIKGKRIIHEPVEPLKNIQSAILKAIFEPISVSPIAHGHVQGLSILTNALPHVKSRSEISFDLENAFGSTNFERHFCWHERYYPYRNGWKILGLNRVMALLVAELVQVTEKEYYPDQRGNVTKTFLPQGAPTSPAIFNLNCRLMDKRLAGLAKNVGGIATRYSDNIFFSWPKKFIERPIIRAIRRIIYDNKFAINEEKTVIINNGNRFGVPLRFCGINIMEGELFIPRKTLRHLRMKLYCAGKAEKPEVNSGIRGYALQIMAGMPEQLDNVYFKAAGRDLDQEAKDLLIYITKDLKTF